MESAIIESSDSLLKRIPPCLESCPTEVLLLVASHVGTSRWLLNMMLTSKSLLSTAESQLYVTYRPSYPMDRGPHNFLCRILARSDLAYQVRNFHECPKYGEFEDCNISSDRRDDRKRIYSAIIKTGVFKSRKHNLNWATRIVQGLPGSWDAATALCILILPNLEVVHLGRWERGNFDINSQYRYLPYLKTIIQHAGLEQRLTKSLACFAPKLCTIVLHLGLCDDQYFGEDEEHELARDISSILPFLYLPTVHTFVVMCNDVIWGCHADFRHWDAMCIGTSPKFYTKNLSMQNVRLSEQNLIKLLLCFSALESFLYAPLHLGNLSTSMEPYSGIMQAIRHLKPCLQKIGIRSHSQYDDPNDIWDCIGSFRDFEKLKSIDMTYSLLLGTCRRTNGSGEYKPEQTLVQALPASIETLRLTHTRDFKGFDGSLAIELLSNVASFPRLRSVDFGCTNLLLPSAPDVFMPQGFTLVEYAMLHSLCCDAGVEMVVHSYTPQIRLLVWMAMAEQDGSGSCNPVEVERKGDCYYPFTDFESMCNEAAREVDLIHSLEDTLSTTTPRTKTISLTYSHCSRHTRWVNNIIVHMRRECVSPFSDFLQICHEIGREADVLGFYRDSPPRIVIA